MSSVSESNRRLVNSFSELPPVNPAALAAAEELPEQSQMRFAYKAAMKVANFVPQFFIHIIPTFIWNWLYKDGKGILAPKSEAEASIFSKKMIDTLRGKHLLHWYDFDSEKKAEKVFNVAQRSISSIIFDYTNATTPEQKARVIELAKALAKEKVIKFSDFFRADDLKERLKLKHKELLGELIKAGLFSLTPFANFNIKKVTNWNHWFKVEDLISKPSYLRTLIKHDSKTQGTENQNSKISQFIQDLAGKLQAAEGEAKTSLLKGAAKLHNEGIVRLDHFPDLEAAQSLIKALIEAEEIKLSSLKKTIAQLFEKEVITVEHLFGLGKNGDEKLIHSILESNPTLRPSLASAILNRVESNNPQDQAFFRNALHTGNLGWDDFKEHVQDRASDVAKLFKQAPKTVKTDLIHPFVAELKHDNDDHVEAATSLVTQKLVEPKTLMEKHQTLFQRVHEKTQALIDSGASTGSRLLKTFSRLSSRAHLNTTQHQSDETLAETEITEHDLDTLSHEEETNRGFAESDVASTVTQEQVEDNSK